MKGPIGSQVEAAFLLEGGDSNAPFILWSSCECNKITIAPEPVASLDRFEVRLAAMVPYDGRWFSASAVVGRLGWPIGRGTLISLAVMDDGTAYMVASPERVEIPGGDWTTGEPVLVQFDLRVRGSHSIEDPVLSIAATFEAGTARISRVVRVVETHDAAFSGRLELELAPAQGHARGGKVMLSLKAEPAVGCALHVAVQPP